MVADQAKEEGIELPQLVPKIVISLPNSSDYNNMHICSVIFKFFATTWAQAYTTVPWLAWFAYDLIILQRDVSWDAERARTPYT